MVVINKQGRLALKEVKTRRLFISFIICKDEKNQLVLIGSQSPSLADYNQPYFRVTKKEKVQLHKAVLKANMCGRPLVNESDMYDIEQYSYKVVDITSIDEKKVMDIYSLRL